MTLIMCLIVGLFSGFLAGKIVEGHGFGTVGDIIIGMTGSFIGGFLFTSAGSHNLSLTGAVLTSTAGAVVFLVFTGIISGFVRRPGRT